ncbi:MAG: prolipoprotein diacylglyceryl transferase [Herpetosiphonaceae bacterium]|nr:MAG: prolipoprotein diacylglyceryl transferase [Herpetosiphonaceae bacterium]
MYPPDDPFLINTTIGGIYLTIRWYAVFILGGVMIAGMIGTRRARDRGYNPDHVWNALMLGLILGVLFARLWYVAFEWKRFEGQPILTILNPATGGLAMHGAILGGALAAAIYTRRHKLNLLDWLDIAAPGYAIAQAIGRWGNFFNQEAYGRPMADPRPWGLRIDPEHRIPPYNDLAQFPEATRFHPTFLYESLWNLTVFLSLLLVERRWGAKLRRGDTALLYGVFYSIGRFFVEDLRVDKLCTGGVGGVVCEQGFSTARLVSVVLILVCSAIFIGRRLLRPKPPASAYQPLGQTWPPDKGVAGTLEPTQDAIAEETTGEQAADAGGNQRPQEGQPAG